MNFSASVIDVPTFGDTDGFLGVIESGSVVPFDLKRVYFIYGVPESVERGSHGHKKLEQLIIPVSGSFDVQLHNGTESRTFSLNTPTKGLLLSPGLWRDLKNFSSDAVCLVLASQHFDEDDYIRDFEEFKEWALKL